MVLSGDACWCPIIRLELWNGARGDHEKKVLRDLEGRLQELEIGPEVWSSACDLARGTPLAWEHVGAPPGSSSADAGPGYLPILYRWTW